MKHETRQAFWTTIVIHAIAVLALLIPLLLNAIRPEKKVHVFELVAPPSPAVDAEAENAELLPLETPPDLPEVPTLPDLPEPAPPPPQAVAPAPKPAPSPAPKPAPKPAPQAPQLTRYEDFIQQNPIREPRQRAPQPREVPRVARIDTQRMKQELNELLQQSPDRARVSQMTSEEQSALAQYGARLNARLNAAWVKPGGLSGRQYICTVIFDVSASGTIRNVRLNPSSGNAAFDQSVKAAFSKVVQAGPTPTGDGHTFTMRFKLVE